MAGAPSREVAALLSTHLTSRSCQVSIWDVRDEDVIGENASPDACEDPRIGRLLRARTARGHLVLVVGLDSVDHELLRALCRWLDGLLVIASSGKARALDLRSLLAAVPRLEQRIAAVLLDQPDELGPREVRGHDWLPQDTARALQQESTRRRTRKRALRGAPP
jgi:hypothetical protein